jgi:glutamate racemase
MNSAAPSPCHRPDLPIALFDSGAGGLSVWREVAALLPNESTIYLADHAHVPYGLRPAAEIEALTHAAVAWLLAQGAKLVVIACNTASAAALASLRQRWPGIPIVGMEPAVKPASERTRSGKVAVMATPGTLQAGRFSSLVERYAGGVEVYTQVCPGLVEHVEAGELDGPALESTLHGYLDPLVAAGVDHLVLGCTHYPFLVPVIRRVVGEEITILDPAPAVARQVQRLLQTDDCLANGAEQPTHRFYTTGPSEQLRLNLARLLDLDTHYTDQIWQIRSATS